MTVQTVLTEDCNGGFMRSVHRNLLVANLTSGLRRGSTHDLALRLLRGHVHCEETSVTTCPRLVELYCSVALARPRAYTQTKRHLTSHLCYAHAVRQYYHGVVAS